MNRVQAPTQNTIPISGTSVVDGNKNIDKNQHLEKLKQEFIDILAQKKLKKECTNLRKDILKRIDKANTPKGFKQLKQEKSYLSMGGSGYSLSCESNGSEIFLVPIQSDLTAENYQKLMNDVASILESYGQNSSNEETLEQRFNNIKKELAKEKLTEPNIKVMEENFDQAGQIIMESSDSSESIQTENVKGNYKGDLLRKHQAVDPKKLSQSESDARSDVLATANYFSPDSSSLQNENTRQTEQANVPQAIEQPTKSEFIESTGKAEFTPGFENTRNQCFANSGLKQLITCLTLPEIKLLKQEFIHKKTIAEGMQPDSLERNTNPPNVSTTPARDALAMAFFDLAEEVLLIRQQKQTGENIENLHTAFFEKAQKLGKADEEGSHVYKDLFPENCPQPQSDPEEMLTTLYDCIGLNNIHNYLEDCTLNLELVNDQNINSFKGYPYMGASPGPYAQITPTGNNLLDYFDCTTMVIENVDKAETKQLHQFGHAEPKTLKWVRLQSKLFSGIPPYSRKTKEARALLDDLNDNNIMLKLLNETTGEEEKYPFQIQSIVVHLGKSVTSGHYVMLEQQDGKWFLHNDTNVSKLEGTMKDYFDKETDAVPYLISLHQVEQPTI